MEQNNNKGLVIALVVMTLLAGVFAYLYYQQRNLSAQLRDDLGTRITELAATEVKLDSISKELDAKIREIEGLGGDLEELTKMKNQLEADRLALRRGNTNLTNKIREYEIFLRQKDEEIVHLREENQQLLSERDELVTITETLRREKQTVEDSLTGALAKTEVLEGKVHLASALKARDIKIFAISPKGKVRDGERARARRIDKIRVDFMLEKNPLAEQNTKLIYLRILDPNGATISDTSTGSGTFLFEGETHPYTFTKEVNYNNTNQDVSIIYDRTGDFNPGTYTVQLYCEGFLIGENTFTIR
ncbi:MAG: hypothetical protein WCY86_00435 [Spirosomataceae bacterium]